MIKEILKTGEFYVFSTILILAGIFFIANHYFPNLLEDTLKNEMGLTIISIILLIFLLVIVELFIKIFKKFRKTKKS